MNAATVLAFVGPVLGVGLIVLALVMERRERRKRDDAKRLGLGGRAVCR